MGTVYLAEHTHMKKLVAVKLLHPELHDNTEMSARFEREARAAAHLDHPNVAAATDFGKTEDGCFFLVLEYIEGTRLRDALSRERFSVGRSLRIARQIALALERAHESGIVHRDLKPENVMLVTKDKPDFVKVLDFGIAKLVEPARRNETDSARELAKPAGQARRTDAAPVLTRVGTILGTPEYMAPEQALGEPVTPAADLYALGIVMYEMLTGKHPFDPPDRSAMLSFHIVAPVPPMEDRAPDRDIPAAVETVVRKLLEKDPKNRFEDARALVNAIDAATDVPSHVELLAASGALPSRPRRVTQPASSNAVVADSGGAPRKDSVDAFAQTSVGELSSERLGLAASRAERDGPEVLPGRRGALRDVFSPVYMRAIGILAIAGLMMSGALIVLRTCASEAGPAPGTPSIVVRPAGEASATPALAPSSTGLGSGVDGSAAQGADALAVLSEKFPANPALLRKLAFAYDAEARGADAMRTVRALLTKAPDAARDDEIVALVSKHIRGDGADEAFALLEQSFGARGVDTLIELGSKGVENTKEYKHLHARINKSLLKAEVREHASEAALVLLDLKATPLCGGKRELMGRAKASGDARLLPHLKSLRVTTGCGFLSRKDCFPCLRGAGGGLDDAIRAIEARASRK
jgi:serine/threonine-protein kinase